MMNTRGFLATLGRPLLLAAIVVALIAAYFIWVGEVPRSEPALDSDSLARDRPTGAGTAPEGLADPLIDGPNQAEADVDGDATPAEGEGPEAPVQNDQDTTEQQTTE